MNLEKAAEVYTTSDYSLFSYKRGNRIVDQSHVSELAEKFKTSGQMVPAMVTSDFKIIDGQHRFEACQLAGIPFKFYFEEKNITVKDIADLNMSSSKWTVRDFAHSYAVQGKEGYKLYKAFQAAYPEFAHSVRLTFLSGITKRSSKLEKSFMEGNFEVASYNKAKQYAEFIRSLAPYYDGYKRRGFVMAVLHLMEHPDFDKERFLRKLPRRCKDILDFSQTDDYIEVLQSIYNWKDSKKVSFTY